MLPHKIIKAGSPSIDIPSQSDPGSFKRGFLLWLPAGSVDDAPAGLVALCLQNEWGVMTMTEVDQADVVVLIRNTRPFSLSSVRPA